MARAKDDMSWAEVGKLSTTYLKIPFALLCVEAFYWFLTQPSNTLAPIQVTEAWTWHMLTELIYGAGSSSLGYEGGWLTKVTLYHPDFYPYAGVSAISLYVSDECAGVHEMIFISTLVMMTDGVSQRMRLKTCAVMCVIVYILNIMRLLAFYPIAISGCVENPGLINCEGPMWQFHIMVYEWLFLVVLLSMWLVWFKWIGASKSMKKAAARERYQWKFAWRSSWQKIHIATAVIGIGLIVLAILNITTSQDAMDAKRLVDVCSFQDLITSQCNDAQNDWNNQISSSWSMASIGMLALAGMGITISKPVEQQSEEEE